MEKKAISKSERKKWITLFMVMTPSILLAASSGIENLMVRVIFDVMLFCLQLLVLKALFDDWWDKD